MSKKAIRSVDKAIALRTKAKLPKLPLSPVAVCKVCGKPM